jgi:molybdate transport system ATP-binding protein
MGASVMGLDLKITTKLEGFTLDVQWCMGDELIVLFGHSGAGKSLTLRTIAGIALQGGGYLKLNGRMLFDSEKNINVPPQQRSVGYVFQDLALFPHMTIEKNILYGALGIDHCKASKRAGELMEMFRLTDHKNKYPREISGGQQQRVAFARALIRQPEILLLDEPFSALDDQLRLEMRKCLTDVVKSEFHIPAVLVTHNVLEAYTLADRVLIYSGGRVVQSGLPQTVFANPVNEEVMSLVKLLKLYPAHLLA